MKNRLKIERPYDLCENFTSIDVSTSGGIVLILMRTVDISSRQLL